ncbi:MAG: FAD:protein FMN transferase [Gammaproteobacteria bacterium]|nr:FAD:protein FMN transferase [Gammaproteobacteria bacterium]
MPSSYSLVIASSQGQKRREIRLELAEDAWHGRFQAMGSPCELVCEAKKRHEALELTELVAGEAWRIEDKFSRYRAGNVVHRINTAGGRAVEVDDETADLLDFAVTLYNLSERRFDITSGVLRRAWHFDGGDRVPSENIVSDVLRLVGWHRADWRRPFLQMPSGMEIDLGGIGKEYAVDRCAGLLREQGSSACLVNFGGDLAVSRAPEGRRSWKVAVEGDAEGEPAHLIDLKQGALATSGDARRYLLKDGIRYSHILDPMTGWPVPDAPRSITIAADTCVEAGMMSTLAMLKGAQAEPFLRAQDVVFWCRR